MPKINYKPANLRGLGIDFQLKPGSNDVPDDLWAKWSKDSEIRGLIEAGQIEVEGKPAKRAPKPPPPPKALAPKVEAPKADEPKPEESDDLGEISDEELERLTSDATK